MLGTKLTHPGPSVGVLANWIGRLYLWAARWEVRGEAPDCAKAVIIAAPHTTNWDLPYMLAAAFSLRIRPSWAGKRALFRWPFGGFMRWLGGVPIDRSKRRNAVQQLADRFAESQGLYLAVAPAGTRQRTDHWKSGFYHIATEADVPVFCGYLDYTRKRAGLLETFYPSGDIHADMERLRDLYRGIEGKFTENTSDIRLKEERSEP